MQAHFDLGMSYAHAGRHADAIAEFERYLEGPRRRHVMVAVLGHTYALAGQVDRARSILAELRAQHTSEGSTVAGRAYIHVGAKAMATRGEIVDPASE